MMRYVLAVILLLLCISFTYGESLSTTVKNLVANIPHLNSFTDVHADVVTIINTVDTNTTTDVTTAQRQQLRDVVFERFYNLTQDNQVYFTTGNMANIVKFVNQTNYLTSNGRQLVAKTIGSQACLITAPYASNVLTGILNLFDIIKSTDSSVNTVIGGQFTKASECLEKGLVTTGGDHSLTSISGFELVVVQNSTGLQGKIVSIGSKLNVTLPHNTLIEKGVDYVAVAYTTLPALGNVLSSSPVTPSAIVNFYTTAGVKVDVGKFTGNNLMVDFGEQTATYDATKVYECRVFNPEINNWDADYCTTLSSSESKISCGCSRAGAVAAFSTTKPVYFWWLIPVGVCLFFIAVAVFISVVLLAVVNSISDEPEYVEKTAAPVNELIEKVRSKFSKNSKDTSAPAVKDVELEVVQTNEEGNAPAEQAAADNVEAPAEEANAEGNDQAEESNAEGNDQAEESNADDENKAENAEA